MDAVIPLWLKIAYTAFVAVTVIVYARRYPPENFLWFSDIALIMLVPALWLESSLLASMVAVGILLPEVLWNVSFFGQLVTGRRISGLADYMFDARKPVWLRALSLFHVVLPPLAVWTVMTLGHDSDALLAQSMLAWLVLPVAYRYGSREENVNWVFGPGGTPQTMMPALAWLALMLAGFPLAIYLPTDLLLRALAG